MKKLLLNKYIQIFKIFNHNKIKKYTPYIILFFLLIISILLIDYTSINITNLQVKDLKGKVREADLPFSQYSKEKGTYMFTGKFYCSKITQKVINIIPDAGVDYIMINGRKVSFDNIDIRLLSDKEQGVHIDISPYIHEGENSFEIKIYSYGLTGLKINNSFKDRLHMFLSMSIILLAGILFYIILNRFNLDRITIIIMICGLTVRLIYLFNTDYTERNYDIKGHMEYIQYMGTNYSLPEPDKGWESFQPPLYYLTGTIVYKLAHMAGLSGTKALQVLSLIYFQIFLIFGIFILKKTKFFSEESKIPYYFAVALLDFWPSGIINSARITNDVLSYMFYTAGIYFLMKWHDEERDIFLYITSICTFLATMTKFNGILIGVISIMLLIYKLIKGKHKKKYIKNIIIISIIISAGILLIFLRNYRYVKDNNDWILLNADGLTEWLVVTNKANNYLYFDTENFIKEPFTSSSDDNMGRQFFWNYLCKTALFGEFSFTYSLHRNIGIIISFLFLIILIFFITGLLFFQKSQVQTFGILLLNMFVLILSIISYRIKHNFACVGDFRYIYPLLITCIPVYIYTINRCKEKIILLWTGYITTCLFIISTILFFITL
ncbi:MAG: hypothetical protein ABRQ39_12595 [Candidatus Eremiobacterota bacterium]